MKSLIDLILESDNDSRILDMWRDNMDIEDIVRISKRKKSYIKNLLRINNRKGWESL